MKTKLSKRAKLTLVNIISSIVLLILMLINSMYESASVWSFALAFVLIQCAITLITCIVYYLSIIADAMNKKTISDNKAAHLKNGRTADVSDEYNKNA